MWVGEGQRERRPDEGRGWCRWKRAARITQTFVEGGLDLIPCVPRDPRKPSKDQRLEVTSIWGANTSQVFLTTGADQHWTRIPHGVEGPLSLGASKQVPPWLGRGEEILSSKEVSCRISVAGAHISWRCPQRRSL